MAQLERSQSQRQVETTKTPPTIHTMEQLLRAGESSKFSKQSSTYSPSSSSPSSPFFQRLRHHDSEEQEHGQNQKKSVLTKVKEKAKKLRHSLSKKKHDDANANTNPNPPTSPSSPTDVLELEDAEYFGAPMYESEKALAGNRANAMLYLSPRGNPLSVFPEKHAMSSTSDKHVVVDPNHQEKILNRSMSSRRTTTTQPAAAAAAALTSTLSLPSKTMTTETVAKKQTPVHVIEKPDAAAAPITTKIQGLTVSSKPTEHHHNTSSSPLASSSSSPSSSPIIVKTTRNTSLSHGSPSTPPAKLPSHVLPSLTLRTPSAPVAPAPSSACAWSEKNTNTNTNTSKSTSTSPTTAQIWDKGVSMREYLMNKLEPGEDEKALSQVISEAMSPRRTPGDAGIIEKVREAVNSLLRTEEPAKYADTTTTTTTATATSPTTRLSCQSPVSSYASHRSSFQMSASTIASHTSSDQLPVSTNAQQDYEVAEEETNGRILQAN